MIETPNAFDCADSIRAVTAHDSNFQTGAPFLKGIYVGGAGNVAVVDMTGVTSVIPVAAGAYLRLKVARVNATSTTATSIFGLN